MCLWHFRHAYRQEIEAVLRFYYGVPRQGSDAQVDSFVSYLRRMMNPVEYGDILMVAMFAQMASTPITLVLRDMPIDVPQVGVPAHVQAEEWRFYTECRVRHNYRLVDCVPGSTLPAVRVALAFYGTREHYDAIGKCHSPPYVVLFPNVSSL